MIIQCINCNKKFNVDSNLIPKTGREIQCGSCSHVWFFKKINQNFEKIELDENKPKDKTLDVSQSTDVDKSDKIRSKNQSKKKSGINFFSFLIVFIISIIALIILIDTFKNPLIAIFPNLELILFNLFETLKDIKLFIIDLS